MRNDTRAIEMQGQRMWYVKGLVQCPSHIIAQ